MPEFTKYFPLLCLLLLFHSILPPIAQTPQDTTPILYFLGGDYSRTPFPSMVYTYAQRFMGDHLWARLVRFSSTGLVEAEAAESWSHNLDSSVWTFKLRSDLKWSDGTPITSDQVVRGLHLSRRFNRDGRFTQSIRKIESLDGKIRFVLVRPVPHFLALLAALDQYVFDSKHHLRYSGRYYLPFPTHEDPYFQIHHFKANPYYNLGERAPYDVIFHTSWKEGDIQKAINEKQSVIALTLDYFERDPTKGLVGENRTKTKKYRSISKWLATFVLGRGKNSPLAEVEKRRWLYQNLGQRYKTRGEKVGLNIPIWFNESDVPDAHQAESRLEVPTSKPQKLRTLVARFHKKSTVYQRAIRNIRALGVEVDELSFDSREEASIPMVLESEYDLLYLPYSIALHNQDLFWRHINALSNFRLNWNPGNLLDLAFQEVDPKKRRAIYRRVEKFYEDQALVFPLEIVSTNLILSRAKLASPTSHWNRIFGAWHVRKDP